MIVGNPVTDADLRECLRTHARKRYRLGSAALWPPSRSDLGGH